MEPNRAMQIMQQGYVCRELTGVDLNTKEGIEQYMSSDTPATVCFPAVGVAYRIVTDLLQEPA